MTTLSPVRQADDTGDAAGFAYRTVRSSILEGALEPGAVLSQVALARGLGISRAPLREALRMLASEGLVVGDYNQQLRVTRVDLDDLDQIYAARIALEPLAIRATVPTLDRARLALLQEHVEGMAAADPTGDLRTFRTHHRAFHLGLIELAGARIERMLADLWDHSERYRLRYLGVDSHRATRASRERLEVSQHEHRAMLDAALAGDAGGCAELLVGHLTRTLTALVDEQGRSPRIAPIAIAATSSSFHTPRRTHD